MLADGGIVILWVSGLILAGILGFFFMAVVIVGKVIGFIFRALTGDASERSRPGQAPPPRHTMGRVCPHRRCAHLNPRNARFCARCGRPLRSAYDTDPYG